MNLNKRYGLVLGIAVMLQSCSVTQSYVRPDLQLPETYNHSSDSLNAAALPAYPDFFKDRDLITLLDRVLLKNPDLLMASEAQGEEAGRGE